MKDVHWMLGGAVLGFAFACAQSVDHKVSGGAETVITVDQNICTAENGFYTPEERKGCILCLRGSGDCPDCQAGVAP